MPKSQKDDKNFNGRHLIFRKTGDETNGALLEMEVTYPPHSTQPPYHYHPFQEEHFEVLNGLFRTKIGDLEHTYQSGEEFTIPKNTPHWMHNISTEEGRLLWQIRPALKSQAFFETTWGLETDGRANANGVPNLLQLVVILRAYSNEFRAARPPYWIQWVIFGLLSPIGKILGYRASYPQYSSNV